MSRSRSLDRARRSGRGGQLQAMHAANCCDAALNVGKHRCNAHLYLMEWRTKERRTRDPLSGEVTCPNRLTRVPTRAGARSPPARGRFAATISRRSSARPPPSCSPTGVAADPPHADQQATVRRRWGFPGGSGGGPVHVRQRPSAEIDGGGSRSEQAPVARVAVLRQRAGFRMRTVPRPRRSMSRIGWLSTNRHADVG